MRILDLAEFYSERGGGVRSYLGKLVRTAAQMGHEVVVVAPGPRDEQLALEGKAGRVIRYRAPVMPYDSTYHVPFRVDRMAAIVRAEKPDILQVSTPFVPAWVAAALGNVPVRAYVHHADPIGCYLRPFARQRLPRPLARVLEAPAWAYVARLSRAFDVTIAAGQWLADELVRHRCQRVQVVEFGVDHRDFGPEHASPALRDQLLGPLAKCVDAKLLLVAGRMAIDKRQARLVEAVKRVAACRPVGLVLLGDGPERGRLVEAGRSLESFRYFPFTRDRAQYAEILATVDALVHGSPCETFGFVLAEAMASGTPLVVPDAGGAAALAGPGFSERYPPYGGPDAVETAIRRLLDRSSPQVRTAARNAADALPSTEEHFRNLFRLYEDLLHGGGNGADG
ncbi:MAG: glycosyltransferase [Polyangiaceae bacterium]|nr:glycosyltransferase [Polyangiaceae bacterium]